ncbi:MAG: hypothetical protein PVH61_26715 [Candidatus Aminicenantes bacterium]
MVSDFLPVVDKLDTVVNDFVLGVIDFLWVWIDFSVAVNKFDKKVQVKVKILKKVKKEEKIFTIF